MSQRHPEALARRPTVPLWTIYWLVIGATIVGTSLPRLSHGSWVWRTGSTAAGVYGGVALEWEWVDVAQSAWFAEGDPRWGGRLTSSLKGQNALRFVPGLAVSWLGTWTRHAWPAAVLATVLCWLAAAWAMFRLGRRLLPDPARGRRVGADGAALVALSPGFGAFIGNVDAHPFGYAAAALSLLALEVAWAARRRGESGDRLGAPWLIGAVIFLANGSLELGPVLLAMVWLFYVAAPSVFGAPDGAGGLAASRAGAGWALVVTVTYHALQGGWWLVAAVASLGTVGGYNEGLPLLLRALRGVGSAPVVGSEVTGIGLLTAGGLVNIFTLPVVALAVPGLLVLPRRSALWAVLWVGLVVAASLVTRNFGRVHYLAYPGVYLAAGAAVEWIGALVAGWATVGQVAARRPSAGSGWLRRVTASALRWVVPSWLLYTVGRAVLGDLGGDLTMARHWWPGP